MHTMMRLFYLTLLLVLCQGVHTDKDFDWVKQLPRNFVFGAATAAYQIEGAWNTSGKGENVWDRYTHHVPSKVMDNSNGDIACDSYHLYKEDVAYLKEIGFDMYRFSLSWSRLFPTGFTSFVNPDGVRYYNALIDELLINGIQPMVTLYHNDLPQPLEDIGGWLNPRMADIFGDYARAVFDLFGDKVIWWLTINEPQGITYCYGDAPCPPRLGSLDDIEFIRISKNLLRAHAKAYRIYEKEFKQTYGGQMSIVLSGTLHIPENISDPTHFVLAEKLNQLSFGWYAHPIFSEEGGFPREVKDVIDSKSKYEGRNNASLPYFTSEEVMEVKGTYDFLALNHYSTNTVRPDFKGTNPPVALTQNVIKSAVPGSLSSGCNDKNLMVYPEGLRGSLNWLKNHYNNPFILITENGFCDDVSKDNICDVKRKNFLRDYMKNMLAAINEDGCKVLGYTVWGLLDSMEWSFGYKRKFGLVKVDFDSPKREREMKLSGHFMKELIQKYKYEHYKNESFKQLNAFWPNSHVLRPQ